MRRWGWVVAVLLAACGGDEGPCAAYYRLGRCNAGSLTGTLTCNSAGTATYCDTDRECGDDLPCGRGLVCTIYHDTEARYGARSTCTTPCTASAQCATGCCTFGSNGMQGCVGRTVGGFCLP